MTGNPSVCGARPTFQEHGFPLSAYPPQLKLLKRLGAPNRTASLGRAPASAGPRSHEVLARHRRLVPALVCTHDRFTRPVD